MFLINFSKHDIFMYYINGHKCIVQDLVKLKINLTIPLNFIGWKEHKEFNLRGYMIVENMNGNCQMTFLFIIFFLKKKKQKKNKTPLKGKLDKQMKDREIILSEI